MCFALVRVPLRSENAILMLTTMMFCRFCMSRSVSMVSRLRNPIRHCAVLTASTLPVSVALPALVIFPSVSANRICPDTISGCPYTAPSCPVRIVAFVPSFSTVSTSGRDRLLRNVLVSVMNTDSVGLTPYLPNDFSRFRYISAETSSSWSSACDVLSTSGR